MLFEVGGVQFPGTPFSGWYSLPEVATRDLLDVQRYNLAEVRFDFKYPGNKRILRDYKQVFFKKLLD